MPDAMLLANIEEALLAKTTVASANVAELLRRFNEQALTLVSIKGACRELPPINHGPIDKGEYRKKLGNLRVALEAIGDTAANLAKMATERNAVIDECIAVLPRQALLRHRAELEALKVPTNG